MNAKDYFDNAADTWDDKFQTSELTSFLENLIPQFDLRIGQNVLDVGTGTGVLLPHLAKVVGDSGFVIAIDFSKRMVQKCKTKYSHFKNVDMMVGNIEDVAFTTEFFNTVICFGVFPHLENKEKALRNIKELLKADGKMIIAHALSSEELKAHHRRTSRQVAHAVMPIRTDMVKLLEKTGFMDINIRDEPGCYLCIALKPSKT